MDNDALNRYLEWRATAHGIEVFSKAVGIALDMRKVGFKHYSIRSIAHNIRFHHDLKHGPGPEGFKVNNNFLSFLAREIMRTRPELEGFFEIRDASSQREAA